MRGIEPRSVSRLVSLSFTCVVEVSPSTEFVDSANDLSPCFSHLCSGSPKHQPAFVVYNPTRYQDYLTGDRLLLIRQRQREHCRLQLCFSRLIVRAGREPLTRKRSFHPTSKPITPIEDAIVHQVGMDDKWYWAWDSNPSNLARRASAIPDDKPSMVRMLGIEPRTEVY